MSVSCFSFNHNPRQTISHGLPMSAPGFWSVPQQSGTTKSAAAAASAIPNAANASTAYHGPHAAASARFPPHQWHELTSRSVAAASDLVRHAAPVTAASSFSASSSWPAHVPAPMHAPVSASLQSFPRAAAPAPLSCASMLDSDDYAFSTTRHNSAAALHHSPAGAGVVPSTQSFPMTVA